MTPCCARLTFPPHGGTPHHSTPLRSCRRCAKLKSHSQAQTTVQVQIPSSFPSVRTWASRVVTPAYTACIQSAIVTALTLKAGKEPLHRASDESHPTLSFDQGSKTFCRYVTHQIDIWSLVGGSRPSRSSPLRTGDRCSVCDTLPVSLSIRRPLTV